MGLDMYLMGSKRLCGWDSTPETEELQEHIAPFIGGWKAYSIEFEALYWRKANHIHKWFVDNVQGGVDNCEPHSVSREQLSTLALICVEVLENNEKAGELLPPCSGFFFGSNDISDYYFETLRYTVDTINRLLNDESLNNVTYTYQSSW